MWQYPPVFYSWCSNMACDFLGSIAYTKIAELGPGAHFQVVLLFYLEGRKMLSSSFLHDVFSSGCCWCIFCLFIFIFRSWALLDCESLLLGRGGTPSVQAVQEVLPTLDVLYTMFVTSAREDISLCLWHQHLYRLHWKAQNWALSLTKHNGIPSEWCEWHHF